MDKTIRIDGGIGRVISASGVVEEYARIQLEQGNKTFVLTSFPQALNGLEYIERVYPVQVIADNKVVGPPFVYEDIITKTEYLEPEPYNDFSYYNEEKHLSQVYNKLLNGKGEFISPKMVLTENELQGAKEFVENEKKKNGKKFLLYQPWGSTGGKVVKGCDEKECKNPEEHTRVLQDESYRSFGTEFAKKLCSKLQEEGYLIYVVKTPDQSGFKDALTFQNVELRKIIALIPFVDGIVCCDSFLHHASAALGSPVPTIVLWAGTNHNNLGYKEQINIQSWKKTVYEPNRIPHDHDYYINKNKGSNEFKMEVIDEILDTLKRGKPDGNN